jgi:hypothetical protein
MSENERPQRWHVNPEELKSILGVVSKEIPGIIKNTLSLVFSEEACRKWGKLCNQGVVHDDATI